MSWIVLIIVTLVVGPGLWYGADRLTTGLGLVDIALHLVSLAIWLLCISRVALWLDRDRDLLRRRGIQSDLDQP